MQKWKRESDVTENKPVRNSDETINFSHTNVSGFVKGRPTNIVAGNYSAGKHYMVDEVQLRVFVIKEFDDTDRTANLYASEFILQESNRHPSAIYVSGNDVYVYDRVDHQVYLYTTGGDERGFATYDLPVTHSSYSSTIAITNDRIYVIANAIGFRTEGLRNPHELRGQR